ncbi:hypothetical protein DL771_001721 [Monosporascus sp. 5C6A]|nr:hypothetical protein DL771_001721 [Monosporascus sp. 5C6A]
MSQSSPPKRPAAQRWSVFQFFSMLSSFLVLGILLTPNLGVHARSFSRAERRQEKAGDKYLIGVGKADITGPVVEIGFAGYADTAQKGTGLRQRIYSRAFIVGDLNKPEDRFIYLVLDTQSGDTALRYGILDGLAALGPEYAAYGQGNVAVTGTHSHAGPGAWFNYLLPQITSFGFDKQSYQAIVDGAVLSIKRAHESLEEGYLDIGTVNITDANVNRSLYAYLANPASERAQYADDVDKEMTVLRFQRASDGKNVGVLTWFPVHGTSIYQNSTHVAGDNKGVAALMFEKAMEGEDSAADGFVAGFSQANVGDTTPNVLGACCYENGKLQYEGARSVYDSSDSSRTPVVGSTVKSFHFYHDMSFWNFQLENGTEVQTCPAALGYSFAAGTSDGPGAFDFTQGDSGKPDASPVWTVVKSLLRVPTAEQKACQQPKPILLDPGEQSVPYDWSPNIVDVQMLRVGQFVIIVSPGEASTMAGRRWRAAVKAAASEIIPDAEPVVVLGGPANTYAHYVTTPEEYRVQRYEGASTLYGQWELPAYINLTVSNVRHLADDATGSPAPGPSPPDNRDNSLSFITPVVLDATPLGRSFGDCTRQPAATYARGTVVSATFVGANPRNDLRLGGTFAAVEKRRDNSGSGDGNEEWVRVRDDSDWFLVYAWKRTNTLLGHSEVTISWETEPDAEPGTYRLRYYGDAKALVGGRITPFEGTSNSFTLT